jgi:hypothetical protein
VGAVAVDAAGLDVAAEAVGKERDGVAWEVVVEVLPNAEKRGLGVDDSAGF